MLKAKTHVSCRVCKNPYQGWSAAQQLNRFCGPVCASEWGRMKNDERRHKANKADTRKRREALKTKGDWTKEAQSALNSYIRERDHALPCMACGEFYGGNALTGGGYDAGHYRSRGSAPAMRFHLLNIWRVCTRCNRELSGNIVEMRKNMVLRLGEDRVQGIEHDNRSPRYSVDDLKRIKRIFSRRAKQFRKRREARV